MRDTKLILIEGIPGSGKSTTAGRVKGHFDTENIPAKLYLEADCNNPSDLAWVAVLSKDMYEQFVKKYAQYDHCINKYSEKLEDKILIYYKALEGNCAVNFPREMMSFLSSHEPFDGKVSSEDFCNLSKLRYEYFTETAFAKPEINIFESSYFQNQVNELMLFHCLDKKSIINHLVELAKYYEKLAPVLIYLSQSDVYETIRKVSKERLSRDKDKNPDWIDHVIHYITESNFGKKNGLNGFEGVVEYFKRRKEIELEVMQRIEMPKFIILNDEYNVEKGVRQVIEAISK